MRQAIVHIGTPRTGTTTLQRVLFRRRAALAAAGVLYPDLTPASAAEPHLSHQHLGEALAGRRPARDRRELLDRLDEQVRTSVCDTIFLSYEGLCRLPRAAGGPGTLAALFARHGVAMRTLLTVKPQADYLNSTYTWRIQFLRESRTFAAFLRAHMGHRECDWERTVAPWRAVSTGGVAVVPVRDPGSDRPLVERVLSAVGLGDRAGAAITEDDLGVVENSSPGPLAVEVCRRLRAEGAAFRPDVPAREISRFVEQAARAAGLDRAPFAGLDEDLRARVAARWSAANERFAASVWQAPWSDRVASAAPRPVNEVARSSASAETEAAVRDLLRRTAEAFGAAPNRGPAGLLHRAVAVPATALRLLQRRVRMATRA